MSHEITANGRTPKTSLGSAPTYDLRPAQTKIVVSLRPCTDLQTIKHLLSHGMNVARISSAYGSMKELEALMKRIRIASTTTKRLCAILLETHGTSAMVGPVNINQPNMNTPRTPLTPGDIDNDLNEPNLSIPTQHSSMSRRRRNKIEGLQLIASTLNLKLDSLPQHILENASFAVDTIINEHQEEKENNEEHTENDNDETNSCNGVITKKEKKPKPLMLPLEVTTKASMDGNDKSPCTSRTLSYDSELDHHFVFQPNIYLMTGSVVRIITDRIILGDRRHFSICFPGLCNNLSIGKAILIHPSIRLEVQDIDKVGKILSCLVTQGGVLRESSKVEFPSLTIKLDGNGGGITQQDVNDIGFGVQNHVDFICISKIQSIADIATAKEMVEFQAATIRNMNNMKRNVSYVHIQSSDTLLSDEQHDHCCIKVLAKIEDWKCIYDIHDIITESDGIVIDMVSLLHSHAKYAKNKTHTHLKSEITETINKIVMEARKQAKPASICCDITSQLIMNNMKVNKQLLYQIENDLKLLNDIPGIPINYNNFLTLDDIATIEECVAYNADSICLLSDLNRFKERFAQYQRYHGTKKSTRSEYATDDSWSDLLFIRGVIRSVSDIIKRKEKMYRRRRSTMTTLSGGMKNAWDLDCKSDDNDKSDQSSFASYSDYSDTDEQRKIEEVETIFNSMASSAVKSAFDLNCSLIIVLTQSGRIARIVSKYRPHCIILAITDSEIIAKQCMFISSVFPVLVLNMNGTDSLISRALYIANKYKLIKKKNVKVVVLAGTQSDILDEPCDFIIKYLHIDL
eukprot:790080_1